MSELGDLLELMYTACGRWRTVRFTLRDWSHNERARAAFERRVELLERGGRTSLQVSFHAPGTSDPRPETSEHTMRMWLDGDRSRVEWDRGEGLTAVVHDGSTWWMTSPHEAPMTNDGDPHHHAGRGDDVEHLLDPAGLIAEFQLAPRGAGEVAGRPGIAVHAVPRPREHHLPFVWQLLGADELELVVDAERGIVLRTEALVGGEPYHVRELLEVVFDETFPPETFRIELLPGESFELAGGRRPQQLTLAQSVGRSSFPVFVPARPGRGWQLDHATYFPASERPLMVESVHLAYRHETGAHQFQLAESTEPHPWLGSEELRTVERDGLAMKVLDPGDEDFPMPRHVLVEREGTHVNVMSQDLPVDELIEIAVSLVRAPDSLPPAVER